MPLPFMCAHCAVSGCTADADAAAQTERRQFVQLLAWMRMNPMGYLINCPLVLPIQSSLSASCTHALYLENDAV